MPDLYNLLAAGSVVSGILSVVIAILILLLTITVHELGHYVVGKILKFKINEFAIGMGPAVFKKTKKNGEIFSVRLFPLGGYCAFEGEDGSDGNAEDNKKEGVFDEYDRKNMPDASTGGLSENAFNRKKPWQRILVLLAGATMNFIFAIVLCTVKLTAYGHFELKPSEIIPENMTVGETLEPEDVILEIDGKFVYLSADYVDILSGRKKGDLVKMTVIRSGEKKTVTVSLRNDVDAKSISDLDSCMKALGVGSVVTLKTDGSTIKNGAYLFRFADYLDEENYSLCTRIYTLDELYDRLKTLSAGEKIGVWTYFSGDEKRTLDYLTAPENYDEIDKSSINAVLGAFGISAEPAAVNYQIYSSSVSLGFFESLLRAPAYCFKTLWVTLRSFGELFGGKMALTDLSGPIGTVTITSQFVSSWRFDYILEIAALIGVSIAVFNVLPIPALDGARVVFVIIEWIRKKPINPKIEGIIHFVGLIALIAFAVIVDILKFI